MVNLSRLYVRFSENGQQSIVSSGATKLFLSLKTIASACSKVKNSL